MNARPVIASLIILATIVLVIAILADWIFLGVLIGPLRLSHWLSWMGSLFIVFYSPLFYTLRRSKFPRKKMLLDIHVFGYLIAFSMISVHYAGQLSRPVSNYPPFAEGIALLAMIIFLVITGVLQAFVLKLEKSNKKINRRTNRYFHVCLVLGFYIVVIVHMIANFFSA